MKIPTVTGTISLDELGKTLMHEHLLMAFAGWEGDTLAPARFEEDLIGICVDRIQQLQAAGFSSLLDPCPVDIGRDPEFYAEIASRTGFNILFATGIYNEHFGSAYWRVKMGFDPGAWEYLAEMYVHELTEGVGPSRARPAVIKLAIGPNPASVFENQVIRAAARASQETGAPILTHTDGIGGDILLEKLNTFGVPAHRIIIGHSCGSADRAYHRRIVDGGAYIGFDRFGLEMLRSDEQRIADMHSLLQDGYAKQIIVSHDCAFCQRGGAVSDEVLLTDPMHFSRDVVPRLLNIGIGAETIDSILRDNPRRYFAGDT